MSPARPCLYGLLLCLRNLGDGLGGREGGNPLYATLTLEAKPNAHLDAFGGDGGLQEGDGLVQLGNLLVDGISLDVAEVDDLSVGHNVVIT